MLLTEEPSVSARNTNLLCQGEILWKIPFSKLSMNYKTFSLVESRNENKIDIKMMLFCAKEQIKQKQNQKILLNNNKSSDLSLITFYFQCYYSYFLKYLCV